MHSGQRLWITELLYRPAIHSRAFLFIRLHARLTVYIDRDSGVRKPTVSKSLSPELYPSMSSFMQSGFDTQSKFLCSTQ